jgi:UDP-N-acetylglucosamine--N-acetylmuramyl-(pentapeptide) pyrophosphoryl-undecaprenol N-acetylglucosamine transferase
VVQLLTLESTGTVGVGNRFKVLVLGGSQGSRAVNEAMMAMAAELSGELKKVLYVVHQTGTADEERVRAAYEAAGVQALVHPFIESMAEAYRVADLVICRAGALTVSELEISRRASILVPYPYAADNHQERNAQTLVDAGAGEMLLEKDLSGTKLVEILIRLNGDRKTVQRMAWNAGANAKPAAAAEVVDTMYTLIGRP